MVINGAPEGGQWKQQRADASVDGELGAGGSPMETCGGGNMATATALQSLRHNPGIDSDWSAEEQAILDDGLKKFGNEASLKKYIKIAALLSVKTVRDVALRCKWMAQKIEYGKRRKADEAKKSNHKKERPLDSSLRAATTSVARSPLPITLPLLPVDNDDDISNEEIGGAVGHLLEHNVQLVNQIKNNIDKNEIKKNTDLLVRFRENIFTIIRSMEMPSIMMQMPPLPVKIDSTLADSILPKLTYQNAVPPAT